MLKNLFINPHLLSRISPIDVIEIGLGYLRTRFICLLFTSSVYELILRFAAWEQ